MKNERLDRFVSTTFKRAALATSTLGNTRITELFINLSNSDNRGRILAIAHKFAVSRLKERIIRDTERLYEHKVMAANLLKIPLRKQNTSQDQH